MCSFFFSSRRRHTRWPRDWSSDVCSSDLEQREAGTHKKHKSQLHRIVAAVTLALIAELGSWRSEERRVGKECRGRGWGDAERKKVETDGGAMEESKEETQEKKT